MRICVCVSQRFIVPLTILFSFIEVGQLLSQSMESGPPHLSNRVVIIEPDFQSSRNVSLASTIKTRTSGFEPIRIIKSNPTDTVYMVVATDSLSSIYTFYDVTDISNSYIFGKIKIKDTLQTRDVESVMYVNGEVRLFLLELQSSTEKRPSLTNIISIPLTEQNLLKIKNNSPIYYGDLDNDKTQTIYGIYDAEMLYQFNGKLFIASNTDTLYYYDVSQPGLFSSYPPLSLTPPSLPTLHDLYTTGNRNTRLHEIKGWKRANGNLVLGCPLTRAGMCIVEMDSTGGNISKTYQMYEFDRTTFPDTVINPHKAYYDSTDWTGEKQNKWDWRVCHSIIPYEYEGKEYVLTTDEFAFYPGPRDSSSWRWEALDFYLPNDTTHEADTIRVNEPFSHRLNYRHRNRPRYEGIDPNRFQGAFLRIWDKSKLGRNDTTANNNNLILNAYSVEEDSAHPEGFIGLSNIPKVAPVPTGVHEPYLINNRLYLATYSGGTRILELKGDQIQILGYIDTEQPLSNDINSEHWYAQDGIAMYAKGAYRTVPDPWRPGIVYTSDIYNGLYATRFFDSAFPDTIRHISFQDSVEIGTVDPSNTLTFEVTGDVVIDKDAKVHFVDNTSFNFTNNPTIYVDGKLWLNQNTFNGSMTITVQNGGQLILRPNGSLTLDSSQNIIVKDSGYMLVQSTSIITLNGGTITCQGSGSIVVEDSRGLRGSGTIIGGRIKWVRGLDVREDQTLVFKGGGNFDFDCDPVNQPQYFINNGSVTFEGSADPYVFGDCLDEIRNYESGSFITEAGTTLMHLPTLISWDDALMKSNGTPQDSCAWLFRQDAGLDDYTSLVATQTTFGGSTLNGPPEEWEGILVGSLNSLLDLRNCTVRDIHVDPQYSGSGIHFYESNNASSQIVESKILRPDNGGGKEGDGVFLQPGSATSYVDMECSDINEYWWTGFTSVASIANLTGNKITGNNVGVGLSNGSDVILQRNCIENHVMEGIDVESSDMYFSPQSTIELGQNRIVNNANRQIDVRNGGNVYGGELIYGQRYGSDNNISHSNNSVIRVRVDATSWGVMQYNWWGVPPDITNPGSSWCSFSSSLAATVFDVQGTLYYNPLYCNEIIPVCSPVCGGYAQNPGNVGTLSKSSALPPFAKHIYELRRYAYAGNFAEVYRFIGSMLPNNVSDTAARYAASTLVNLEREHFRNHPDSLSRIRNRLKAFLLARFTASQRSETKAALLNVLSRSLFALRDIQGADSRINQLRNQFPNSPYALDILPTMQLVAMAQHDSVKMNNAIALMQYTTFPAKDMRLALAMKRAYLRYRPQSPYPKNVSNNLDQEFIATTPSLEVRNYPNPFYPSTVIEYTLPEDGHTTLRVYNLFGREVATLVDEEQTAGAHSVVFLADKTVPMGIYIYILTTPSVQAVGRMLLIR